MKLNKLLIGILAGFAGGLLAGILFAPEKGIDMRQTILDKKDEYAGMVKEKFNEIVDIVSEKYSNTVNRAEEGIAEGKSKYEGMITDGKDKYNEAKSGVENAIA
jgi:gas vesicle protein